ncbi:Polyketide biosynthesis associated protein [Mycena chlorophos]|uniref:Polyketide biosynthesis associated protein n=1 Tax=Mycena chlorophos TaxID=658473 RepID=A0A8H6WFS1_MYCCL|nr:Polyketide biosynthesis associated protein [Mycena chlorophos]
MAHRLVKLSVINDLICPNCAIGQHELFAALTYCKEELKLPLCFQIEFLPFRLIPEAVLPQDYQPKVSKKEFFSGLLGSDTYQIMDETFGKWAIEKGVPLSFRGVVSQSTRAHRLSRKAYLMGGMKLQLPFLISVFRAHLQEAKDIADIDVLSDIAAEVGIFTKADAIAWLQTNELESEVNSMCDSALANGVTGVPLTVIDGKWAVSGGQSSDVFVQIFKKLAGTHASNTLPSTFSSLDPCLPSPLIT